MHIDHDGLTLACARRFSQRKLAGGGVLIRTQAPFETKHRRAKRKNIGLILTSIRDWFCVFYPRLIVGLVLRGQWPNFRKISNYLNLH